jgi:hypothetical protein
MSNRSLIFNIIQTNRRSFILAVSGVFLILYMSLMFNEKYRKFAYYTTETNLLAEKIERYKSVDAAWQSLNDKKSTNPLVMGFNKKRVDQFMARDVAESFLNKAMSTLQVEKYKFKFSSSETTRYQDRTYEKNKIEIRLKTLNDQKFYALLTLLQNKMPGIVEFTNFQIQKVTAESHQSGKNHFDANIQFSWSHLKDKTS